MATRFASEISLDDGTRTLLVEKLNEGLATAVDLRSQVKQAHWNVRGPLFYGRHELFDAIAEHLEAHADDLAERAGALGGYATGTVRNASELSAIDEYPTDAVTAQQHLTALTRQFKTFSAWTRQAVETAQAKGDPASEDLFIEVLRSLEQDMWFLHSHLQD